MITQPRINENAFTIIHELSRFWQFKRKSLAAELASHIIEAQVQLDATYQSYGLLSEKCSSQDTDIQTLRVRGSDLDHQLQTKQQELAAIACLFDQEKVTHQVTRAELSQSQATVRQLEERQSHAIEKISQLESFLERQRIELLSKEERFSLLEEIEKQLKASHISLKTSYDDISQQHLTLSEKFDFVRHILAELPPHNQGLTEFAHLINDEYMNFASRESSLAEEAQAMVEMQGILAELQINTHFSSIAGKNILGIAGGFSSGKSAFINSFIKDQSVQLATGINPVTVVPSYIVCSQQTCIKGYSYSGGSIELDGKFYTTLSHEYLKSFGFDLRRILPFISVNVLMDPELFGNLCIIDTPGYNPGFDGATQVSDRNTATEQVKQASALIWVIGLDPAGTISQSDIEFIQNTSFRGGALYIVLNKADVKPEEDIATIMLQVDDALNFSGIEYAGMCAYSSTKKREYGCSGEPFADFLRSHNHKVDVAGIIFRKIDGIFNRYKAAIQGDINQIGNRKRSFDNFKMDALEIGGTVLFDRLDKAFPDADNTFATFHLEQLLEECENLRCKLKESARRILA